MCLVNLYLRDVRDILCMANTFSAENLRGAEEDINLNIYLRLYPITIHPTYTIHANGIFP